MLKHPIKILIILYFVFCSAASSQTIVSSISFSGNDFFSANDLLNSMSLKRDKTFTSVQFDADLKSIREKYRQNGFLTAKITGSELQFNKDSSYVDISISVREGEQIKIGKINISGNSVISTREILNIFETRTGDILNDNALNNDIKSLLDLYEKKGNLFATAKIEDVSIYKEGIVQKISLSINIKEEKSVKINNVKIRGNEDTDEDVILRELKLRNDKSVTRTALQQMKLRLEKLNIFEKVDDPQIYTIKNKYETGLLIQVKEGKANTFDGVLGYVPPAAEGGNGYFTGLVNVSFRNIFGTARRIDARWQQETKTTQELEFRYVEPYTFSLPLNAQLAFLQRLQDTSYTRRKFDIKADVFLSDRFTLGFIGGIDRVIPTDDTTQVLYISDSRILYTGADIKYDSRENIYIPQSGIVYRAFYTYGNKNIYLRANSPPGSSEQVFSVQKYSMDIEVYFSFFSRQSTLFKMFIGQVTSDKLEDNDLYKVGGMKNIRGYRDDQFRASKFTYGTIEFRYAFARKSFAHVFFDPGYYFRDADHINRIDKQEGFLYGYGIGIRLETALGIVGVSYGLGKGDSFLDGKIHFGLINEF